MPYGDVVTDRYRTLLLLRHAKSDYPAGVADHDGPWLRAECGRRHWQATGCAPTPRPSTRCCARPPPAPVRRWPVLESTAPVSYVDRLYDATPGAVIDEINGVDPDVETLLVIGHEPAMSQVALGLATPDGSNTTAAEHISTKFPTSAIAVLRTAQPWDRLALSSAALVTFHVPR